MRYERKYRVPGDGFEAIRAIVETHPQSFRKQFPDRQVNNIYLDSPDLECYWNNLAGAANREKFRIRWYGEITDKVEFPVLELKRKDGELGSKFSQKLQPFGLAKVRELESEIRKQFQLQSCDLRTESFQLPAKVPAVRIRDLLPRINSLKAQIERAGVYSQSAITQEMLSAKLRLYNLRPVLLNAYQRSYYVSSNHRYRLTIDRELRSRSLEQHCSCTGRMTYDPAVVIEVKYDFLNDSKYDQVGQFLPFRAGKNSKYVIGMLLTGQV